MGFRVKVRVGLRRRMTDGDRKSIVTKTRKQRENVLLSLEGSVAITRDSQTYFLMST